MNTGLNWRVLFGIDIRSLALVRVFLAIALLINLYVEGIWASAFFGDQGILPSSLQYSFWNGAFNWSLHLIGGGPMWWVSILFAIHILAALCLLVGYRTRIATIVAWFLLVSLQNADPLILNGGDLLLRVSLFVGMFLPWAESFSVDQALRFQISEKKMILSGWTAAFLAQMGFLYFFSALLKNSPEWMVNGSAVYYALNEDQYATPIAKFLLHFPHLLPIINFGVLGLEAIAIFALFFPLWTARIRIFMVAALALMHVAFRLSLDIGEFSFIAIASLVAFIPSGAWDGFEKWLAQHFGRVAIYYDGECGFCRSWAWIIYSLFALPESRIAVAQTDEDILRDMRDKDSWVVVGRDGSRHFGFDAFATLCLASPIFFFLAPLGWIKPFARIGERVYRTIADNRRRIPFAKEHRAFAIPRHLAWLSSALGILYIAYIFSWQAAAAPILQNFIGFPTQLTFVGEVIRIDQTWNLFSPYPMKGDGWFVMPGILADGSRVDLFRGGTSITYAKPADVRHMYPDERWRKYLVNLWQDTTPAYRNAFARYLCSTWNSAHVGTQHLVRLSVVYMLETTPPPGQPFAKPYPITLVSGRCS